MPGKIGVYGGTFDPPHVGHLIVAGDACEALGLDRLLFIPSAVPPHKRHSVEATAEVRMEMVGAAVAGDERFEVSDLELRRQGPSYTVDTLSTLRERYPGAELYLLVGADVVPDLPTWRAPEEILRLARLAVLARAGDHGGEGSSERDGPIPFVRVPVTRVDVSATEVRRRVREGRPIRYLVTDPVRAIIEREGLYRAVGAEI